ncbi:MAG: hypothetical protein BGO55_07775 [Sphingobacteriales bacterium 50-39]|nr:DUF1735 domain-containing protein [Sphingobacteriales bacterium]OJW53139.1 MAG: hypothetical protein BGO55_07775 [Sphingobacteriales bacterium 50-39]
MNRYHKTLYMLAGVLGLGMAVASCNKPDPLVSKSEGNIYMPQAYSTLGSLKLYLLDSPQTVIFGAAYGGLTFPAKDIKVNFKLDTDLIASYNTQYGTSYVPLPTSNYTIASYAAVIKAGTTSSTPLPITVTTKGLSFGVRYMLPITMTDASSGKIDSNLNRTWFTIDSLYVRERDVTDKGTLSVALENRNGAGSPEGSPHLVDGNLNTKYLTFNFPQPFWFQEQFPAPQVVNSYTFTSGNDSPDRDPMDWNVVGSNDGTNWDTLDVRTGENFASRIETVHYTLNNNSNKAYTYIRVNVTQRNGGAGDGLFQMSEWRLLQYY